MKAKSVSTPALKWCGRKFNNPVARRVAELFAPYRETHLWAEPFAGVCGMTLSIQPERAILVDVCAELIGLHRWIRNGGRYLDLLAGEHSVQGYYQRRERFQALQSQYNASPDFVDHDEFFSLLIWLNKACFNGLWRVNSDGLFNVPAGKNSKGGLYTPNIPDLSKLRSAYQRWAFHHGDFEILPSCIPSIAPDPFVYADPPYFGTHSTYTATSFTWQDQKRLAYWLAECSCPVVASNSDNPDVVDLYKRLGFTVELIEVNRSVAANSSKRQAVFEMLAYKNVNTLGAKS